MTIKVRYWKTLMGLSAVALAAVGLIGCGGTPATTPSNDVKAAQAASSNANTVDTKGQVPDPESPNPTGTGGSVTTGVGGNAGAPGGRTFK